MDPTLTLEEFRKILASQYIQKGIEPPTPNGEKEKLLYDHWLKGKEKIQNLLKNE